MTELHTVGTDTEKDRDVEVTAGLKIDGQMMTSVGWWSKTRFCKYDNGSIKCLDL